MDQKEPQVKVSWLPTTPAKLILRKPILKTVSTLFLLPKPSSFFRFFLAISSSSSSFFHFFFHSSSFFGLVSSIIKFDPLFNTLLFIRCVKSTP
ncbi:hypothetical protein Lalb_Chr10g0094421 [Lupinus albus]|uniref:Uncharacterized protein n=1 Tax=Lupinus albus TaxID=3870 RepID=A0A6A4PUI6_LUPAL|nr:hypothetical protein Lalb_Chr10g0094421 [Lupinus albus]